MPPSSSDEDKLLPPDEKMLLILKEHVRRAKTDKERERAEKELREFMASKGLT